MGDQRRFDRFADFIVRNWPDRNLHIADVAGGKGGLHAALYRRGYVSVVTFDKRRNRANVARQHYRYRWFDESVADEFDLVVAMHPDEATDTALAWAIKHRTPYAVVPCCVKPSTWPFHGPADEWVRHLVRQAERRGSDVRQAVLPISGQATVLFAL